MNLRVANYKKGKIMQQIKLTPWRITIDTNPDQCNLKCVMCDTHSIYNKKRQKRQRMSPQMLERILKEAVDCGVKEIIPSTMGEPLMYPYFDRFIKILTPSHTKLNLTTNGTFPKKGVEQWAELLLPITTDTKISINGISPEINENVMILSKTNEALQNIKTYIKIRDEVRKKNYQPTVTLQVTFMKENLRGIKEVIEFAIANNVDRVKGHHLWVTHQELLNSDLRNPINLGTWDDFVDEITTYKSQIKLENFDKFIEGTSVPEHYLCPFLGQELWLDHEGQYNVCCAPSDQRRTLGEFESIEDTPLNDFFQRADYQVLHQNYKSNQLCRNCSLRKPPE